MINCPSLWIPNDVSKDPAGEPSIDLISQVSPSFSNTTELQLNISLTEKQADEEGELLERLHAGVWGAVVF